MSFNLMEQFKGLLTDQVLSQVTNIVGGDAASVTKGLTAAGGSVLGSIIGKASSAEGAKSIFESLGDGSSLNGLTDLSADSNLLSTGSNLAQSLLGDKTEGVLGMVSQASGLSSEKANTLLGLGTSLVGGLLGKQKASGMGLSAFTSMLGDQGSILEKLMPNLGGLLGIGSLGAMAGKLSGLAGNLGGTATGLASAGIGGLGNVATGAAGAATGAASAVGGAATGAASGGLGILTKIIPLAILAIIGLLLWRNCAGDIGNKAADAANAAKATANSVVETAGDAAHGATNMAADVAHSASNTVKATANAATDMAQDTTEAVANTAKAAADTVANATENVSDTAVAATESVANVAESAGDTAKSVLNAFGQKVGSLFSFKLPNGTALNIPKGGFEDNFASALAKDLKPGTYYDFDRLFFATGSSALNAESMEQINNVASILKAYPNTMVLLRGHTDSQGSVAGNTRLSKARSAAVKAALAKAGVTADRIATTGVAAAHPAATNDTAEGRQRNRRIDISIQDTNM